MIDTFMEGRHYIPNSHAASQSEKRWKYLCGEITMGSDTAIASPYYCALVPIWPQGPHHPRDLRYLLARQPGRQQSSSRASSHPPSLPNPPCASTSSALGTPMAYNVTLVSTNADNFPSNVAIQGFPRLSTFDHSSVLLARPSATVQLADPSCEACLIFSSQSHLSRLWLPWKNPSIAQIPNPALRSLLLGSSRISRGRHAACVQPSETFI